MLLAVALGRPAAEAVSVTTLKEIEPLIIDKYGEGTEAQDKAVRKLLHGGRYMPDEVRLCMWLLLPARGMRGDGALRLLLPPCTPLTRLAAMSD
jgi:hypothetical protein